MLTIWRRMKWLLAPFFLARLAKLKFYLFNKWTTFRLRGYREVSLKYICRRFWYPEFIDRFPLSRSPREYFELVSSNTRIYLFRQVILRPYPFSFPPEPNNCYLCCIKVIIKINGLVCSEILRSNLAYRTLSSNMLRIRL